MRTVPHTETHTFTARLPILVPSCRSMVSSNVTTNPVYVCVRTLYAFPYISKHLRKRIQVQGSVRVFLSHTHKHKDGSQGPQ